MRRPPGIHRSAGTNDRLMIMRLITTVSLALLLLFALAATAHGESGAAGTGSVAATTSVAATSATTPGAADSGATDSGAASAQAALQIVATTPGTNALTGVALCALGVLCGLAALLLLSRVLQRPGRSPLVRTRADAHSSPLHSSPPRVTALSLTRIGLSRT